VGLNCWQLQPGWCRRHAAAHHEHHSAGVRRMCMPQQQPLSLSAACCPRTHAQDGYAVVASDGPGEYAVVGESRAGYMDAITLAPGQVAYITTGVQCVHAMLNWRGSAAERVLVASSVRVQKLCLPHSLLAAHVQRQNTHRRPSAAGSRRSRAGGGHVASSSSSSRGRGGWQQQQQARQHSQGSKAWPGHPAGWL
jgi:hypothetical protein